MFMNVELRKINEALRQFIVDSNTVRFEQRLLEKLSVFNNEFFPSPEFKVLVKDRKIDESKYGSEKEKEFLPVFKELV